MRHVPLAFSIALAACSGGRTNALDTPAAGSTSAVAAISAATATSATASPTTDHAALPVVDVGAIPPSWRDLFVARERAGTYALTDDVDPHDPSGKRIETKLGVVCSVRAPFMMSGSAHGSFECKGEAAEFSLRYWTNEKGLFLQGDGSIPSFPWGSDAEPWSVRFDAGDNTERIPCTRRRERSGSTVCVETRCQVNLGYGDTTERVCLDAGLLEYVTINIGGPRLRRLVRTGR